MTNRRKLAISILIAMFLLLASVGSVWATSRGGETGKHNHFNTGNRGRNHSGRTHRAVGIFDRASMLEVVAAQLGLSATELENAYQEGKEALLELGVDQASLRNAIESAKSQLLAEAVAAGTIIQAEADEMNFSFGHLGKTAHHSLRDRAAHRGPQLPDFMDIGRLQELAADTLGLTEEELESARTEGLNSLDLDRATVVAALQDAWQQLVDEAVAADTITQAEADELTFSLGHWDRAAHHNLRDRAAHRGPQLPDFMDIARLQELAAETLGLTEVELESAKTEGLRTLDLDRATVVAALQDAWQQLVDEAVTAGTITQADADELTFNKNQIEQNDYNRWWRRGHGRWFAHSLVPTH